MTEPIRHECELQLTLMDQLMTIRVKSLETPLDTSVTQIRVEGGASYAAVAPSRIRAKK